MVPINEQEVAINLALLTQGVKNIETILGDMRQEQQEQRKELDSVKGCVDRQGTELTMVKWMGGVVGSGVALALVAAIMGGVLK